MLIFGLNQTIDQLAMAVFMGMVMCWKESCHVLKRVLDFEAESQRKTDQRRHRRGRLRKKYEGWYEKGRCTMPIKAECLH